MKILIIGNGFDLAHYLPTAYAHFMGVMQAIENLPEDKDEVTFDDLFAGLEQSNPFFFARTREIYDGDNLKFNVDKIYELKGKLQDNKWYEFFKRHMEISTWIDFENKIHSVLMVIFRFLKIFSEIKGSNGRVGRQVFNYKVVSSSGIVSLFLGSSDLEILSCFGFLLKSERNSNYNVCADYEVLSGNFISDLKINKFTYFLYEQLSSFSTVFELYLLLIRSSFSKKLFSVDVNSGVFDGLDISRVYSFNYTSTLLDLYPSVLKGEGSLNFLHGSICKGGGIVLGVDDLDFYFLNDLGLHGFLKYHQKLFFDTDYLFLEQDETLQSYIKNDGNKLQIYVWGHSMDVSDGDYVRELFSFTDAKVLLVVFYFGNAKFELLANLLKIVGREKVERWMKKGWLKFEQAPDLYDLNFAKQTV